jgi:hypothetical protein
MDDQVGLIPRALESLFNLYEQNKFVRESCIFKVSFLEIYNDILVDLLNPSERG